MKEKIALLEAKKKSKDINDFEFNKKTLTYLSDLAY